MFDTRMRDMGRTEEPDRAGNLGQVSTWGRAYIYIYVGRAGAEDWHGRHEQRARSRVGPRPKICGGSTLALRRSRRESTGSPSEYFIAG